ncbi:DOPA 4,5-dioxygenase family protein [Roseomonas sp. JC162]|uniref:DOPA 4,5-dioxygenase family protein n=1 Tax=Neoroseomonas marina TaxID=1232220 RepID=A0A848EG69_9PROT|nr:DOPA 4,5-dioxygenase family protein [Neoroseomonas marina]NMJ43644.1 DOPA 4,5-dioxygenase family protein [Neoroseomonas marina]
MFAAPDSIQGWHAHIYYDPTTREAAARLREGIADAFPEARLGRWHDVPVGPHPQAMYQVAFAPALFPTLMPFIALNREGLTVLVHPETGRQKVDHLEHAVWMGAVLPLDASVLPD